MNRKRLFYGIALLFLAMTAAAAIAVFRVNVRSGDERAVAVISRRDERFQAAQWIFSQSPFCYRFKNKVAYLPSLSPFTQDLGRIERQNSNGFRTSEYTIARPPNTFRILVLGNSLVWAGGVPLENTFPYIASILMNRDCSRFHTEVISLGLNLGRVADSLTRLLVHGQYLKPDLVVFQMSPGDLNFYNYGTIFFLHGLPNLFTAYSTKQEEVLSDNSADMLVFKESLAAIKTWSSAKKVPVAFLVFPEIDSQRAGKNFMAYDPGWVASMPQISQFQKAVDVIQNEGFPTLYLLDTFKKSGKYLTVSEQVNDLNPPAQRLVAEQLVSFLSDRNLINCGRSEIRQGDPLWKSEQALREKAAMHWQEFNSSFALQRPFFESLSQMYPKDPWITKELADVYLTLRQYRQAYRTYASLLDLAPELSAPWYHMAISGTSQEERIRLLEKMLQEVPDHTPSLQSLARLYLEINRQKDACKLLSRLIEIPTYAQEYASAKKLFEENGCSKMIQKTDPK